MKLIALRASHICVSVLLQIVVRPHAHVLRDYLSKASLFQQRSSAVACKWRPHGSHRVGLPSVIDATWNLTQTVGTIQQGSVAPAAAPDRSQ